MIRTRTKNFYLTSDETGLFWTASDLEWIEPPAQSPRAFCFSLQPSAKPMAGTPTHQRSTYGRWLNPHAMERGPRRAATGFSKVTDRLQASEAGNRQAPRSMPAILSPTKDDAGRRSAPWSRKALPLPHAGNSARTTRRSPIRQATERAQADWMRRRNEELRKQRQPSPLRARLRATKHPLPQGER